MYTALCELPGRKVVNGFDPIRAFFTGSLMAAELWFGNGV